ncbi:hypothetical protein [Novosphingobium sp. Fuku2-ISO-50]
MIPPWAAALSMRHREAATMSRKAVRFVCLGNICRSPMAEVALRLAR